MNNFLSDFTPPVNHCPACGAADANRCGDLGHFKAFCCNSCSTVFALPLPTPDALRTAYQSFDAGELSRKEFDLYKDGAVSMLRSVLFDLEDTSIAKKRFLDYGCGGAHFVAAAQELGFNAMGVDIDEASVHAGCERGLKLATITQFEESTEEKFDVIWMFHVIEHLLIPIDTITQLRNRLVPGGRLIVATPDQASIPSKIKILLRSVGIRSEDYGFVQPPIHLVGFTRSGLEQIGRRAGMTPLSITSVSAVDRQWFPVGAQYWKQLRIQQLIYSLGAVFDSGGHLVACYQRPR